MTAPTEENLIMRQTQIDRMKMFLTTANHEWETNKSIKRFILPNSEAISCVLWDNVFFISGTDIVRSLTFRFHAFGRPVTNPKKFEEGIFSDLRNLKPGHDARLEEPKSELLDMLYKNNCIRTQKKQKVFYWLSVPHDRLFLDALERDLKREKMGLESTTEAIVRPATLLTLDSTQELFDDLRKNMSKASPLVTPKGDPWSPLENQVKRSRIHSLPAKMDKTRHPSYFTPADSTVKPQFMQRDFLDPINQLEISNSKVSQSKSLDLKKQRALFGNLSLLDGSPSYKQRRRRTLSSTQSSPSTSPLHAGRRHGHENCHHPTPVKTNFSRVASFGSPPPLKSSTKSRLAIAACKAGWNPTRQINWSEPEMKPAQPVEIDWHHQPVEIQYKPVEIQYKPVETQYNPVEMTCKPVDINYKTMHQEATVDEMDWQEPEIKSEPMLCCPMPTSQHTTFELEKDKRVKEEPYVNYGQCTFRQEQWGMLGFDPIGYDQPMYDPILSATSSTNSLQYYDDDLSSSTASSPSDTFHNMTLFSPFKPIQEHEDQDSLSFDQYYASYITPDMNFVFGA
ncbi:unnamed protein product [Rhizopus stolonifer]